MKRFMVILSIARLFVPALAWAQTQAPTGQKTLAATMNVYVFPKSGQDKQQQSQHEVECYSWAVENVGADPFELGKQAARAEQQAERTKAQAKKAGKGAGAKSAVAGAAVGALIGEIANDDAGKGAAYGAGAGLLAGRRRARRGAKQSSQKADQQVAQTQQATAAQLDNFKKAFSVCLEAKDYMVKY